MIKCIPFGDSAFILSLGEKISPKAYNRVQTIFSLINQKRIKGIKELVPTYNDVIVHYDPTIIGYKELAPKLECLDEDLKELHLPSPELIHIPVLYGGKKGSDLRHVAEYCKLEKEDIIELHQERKYLIHMLGFTPGFCYLGGMNEKIFCPRKNNPEKKIAGGSVGIANEQTGIYPIDSPGGWQIIGRTPLRLFDLSKNPEFLFKTGDYVKFQSITEKEFEEIEKQVLEGKYKLITENLSNHG